MLNASKLYKSIKPRYVSTFIDLMDNVSLMLNETVAPYTVFTYISDNQGRESVGL